MEPLPIDIDGEIIHREVVVHEKAITDRSLARRVALQALYEIDSAGHAPGEVLSHHLRRARREQINIRGHLLRLINGVLTALGPLDEIIQEYASEWPLKQVAVIDRNILRIALFEFGIEQRTPVSVAIDEAVLLAKLFGSETAHRFVNGVLGALANDVEPIRERLIAFAPKPPGKDEAG